MLIADQEKLWQTELQASIGKSPAVMKPKPGVVEKTLRDDKHTFRADQLKHKEVVDRKKLIFPGHQPELDKASERDPWETEQRASFGNPGGKDLVIRQFVGGKGCANPWVDRRPYQDQVDEYIQTWTRNSKKTKERFNSSESRRQFKHCSADVLIANKVDRI
eukprot:TRINITY_DN21448_c0_g1_i1.p2 TRINITY_DN21448_c0_g1~~TRINITY_DN21448_c0_g1_i1.p2  ORF type:complete len:162 (+),score=19.98 TRINITY_DN21448_c0_g1_i1:247-732(+)